MTEEVDRLLEQARRERLEDRPDAARSLLVRAVALAREAEGPALGRALAGLGQIARDQGEEAEALRLYREAAALAEDGDDVLVFAHRLRHIGDMHLDAGRLDEAGPLYDRALAFYRGRDDARPLDLANALRPMAILKHKQGQAETAERLWAEARTLYEQAGVRVGPDIPSLPADRQ